MESLQLRLIFSDLLSSVDQLKENFSNKASRIFWRIIFFQQKHQTFFRFWTKEAMCRDKTLPGGIQPGQALKNMLDLLLVHMLFIYIFLSSSRDSSFDSVEVTCIYLRSYTCRHVNV